MIKIIKYLDHELIRSNPNYDINDYRCINCNILLYQAANEKYFFIDENSHNVYNFIYTCKEWIIKNIIE